MEVIFRGRQKGKTIETIRRCAAQGGYVVCVTHREAVRVAKVAEELGYKIPFPLTALEFFRGNYSTQIKLLHLDNADLILQALARVPIATLTLTPRAGGEEEG